MAKGKSGAPSGFSERGGDILSWEKDMRVEGMYMGTTPPRSEDSSPIMRVQTADGVVRYWVPAILESKLEDFEKGEAIIIECFGKVEPIKSGKWKGTLAWKFKVYGKE